MNRLAPLLVLTLCLPLAAHADDASKRAKAEEMMILLHTERMVQQVSDNITREVSEAAQKAVSTTPSPDQKAKLDAFEKQAAALIDAQVGWKAMHSEFTDVYAKAFTEEQLDGIIAFYKSPAGTALLANMPTINAQVGQIGQARIAVLQPQLKELYTNFQKSLIAPPPAATPAPATPPSATPPAGTPK